MTRARRALLALLVPLLGVSCAGQPAISSSSLPSSPMPSPTAFAPKALDAREIARALAPPGSTYVNVTRTKNGLVEITHELSSESLESIGAHYPRAIADAGLTLVRSRPAGVHGEQIMELAAPDGSPYGLVMLAQIGGVLHVELVVGPLWSRIAAFTDRLVPPMSREITFHAGSRFYANYDAAGSIAELQDFYRAALEAGGMRVTSTTTMRPEDEEDEVVTLSFVGEGELACSGSVSLFRNSVIDQGFDRGIVLVMDFA